VCWPKVLPAARLGTLGQPLTHVDAVRFQPQAALQRRIDLSVNVVLHIDGVLRKTWQPAEIVPRDIKVSKS